MFGWAHVPSLHAHAYKRAEQGVWLACCTVCADAKIGGMQAPAAVMQSNWPSLWSLAEVEK
jgi:hypothetical protein